MIDNSMIEKWNVIDAADMAVSAEGILQRYLNRKPMPFDYERSLLQAIDFLEEASTGGAIICGNVQTNGFTGTLSPLLWSTSVYIEAETKEKPTREDEIYKNVTKTLQVYKNLLEKIKHNQTVGGRQEIEQLRKVHCFFSSLAEILLHQADPLTRTYSQPV